MKVKDNKTIANYAILGDAILSLRTSKGLTRQELCKRAGVSSAFLFDLEHGRLDNPSMRHTELVAEALGTTLATLLTRARTRNDCMALDLSFYLPDGLVMNPQSLARAQRVMQEVLNAMLREQND